MPLPGQVHEVLSLVTITSTQLLLSSVLPQALQLFSMKSEFSFKQSQETVRKCENTRQQILAFVLLSYFSSHKRSFSSHTCICYFCPSKKYKSCFPHQNIPYTGPEDPTLVLPTTAGFTTARLEATANRVITKSHYWQDLYFR